MEKKLTKKTQLNWLSLSRIYWKEQILFFLVTVASAIMNFIVDINVIDLVQKIVKSKGKIADIEGGLSFLFFNKEIKFQELKNYFFFFFIYLSLYSLVVFFHVQISFFINNKIIAKIKNLIIDKTFLLPEKNYKKEQILSNLNSDLERFAKMVFFVPNQIVYLLITACLSFVGIWKNANIEKIKENGIFWKGNIILWGISFFFLIAITCCLINYYVYQQDLKFQKNWESIREIENLIVNNKKLIIKKGKEKEYKEKFTELIKRISQEANKKDCIYSAALVFPSYALIPYAENIILPWICFLFGYDFSSLRLLTNILSQEKKLFDRLKDYPYYFSAKKRLNHLLAQEEKNEEQKNLILNEEVEKISLKNLSFSYNQKEQVFSNLNLEFKKGEINHLTGKNGFGKSTIIDLIMGVIEPDNGQIIINDKYNLQDLNLKKWRKKIIYSEHNNLLPNKLSTGQKQLLDIDAALNYSQDKLKEIFIFDEADNALDIENKKIFRREIDKIKSQKLVVIISH